MNIALFYQHLYDWYGKNARPLPWRETQSAYHIWLSEIILQQTRVAQGTDYYYRFIQRFPTIEDLAQATEDEVLRLWQGLGYYSRARNLHKAAREIGTTRRFPTTYEGLRRMPGVGEYTAGAVASFAYNLPYPAIDGNVMRVLARLDDSELPVDSAEGKQYFRQRAFDLLDRQNPRLFNNAIMELGALQCLPQNPDCKRCPIRHFCLANKHNTATLLPVRKQKQPLQDRYLNYTIYISHQTTLLHQRMANDIWKHLWEFPLKEQTEPFTDKTQEKPVTEMKHILSHRRLHIRFYVRQAEKLPELPDTKVVALSGLDDYAMPRPILRALESPLMQRIIDSSQ